MTSDLNAINSRISQANESPAEKSNDESRLLYLIINIQGNLFALNCRHIVSIEEMAASTETLNKTNEMRGISYYKNEAVSIFDARAVLGFKSQIEYIEREINVPGHIAEHKLFAERLEGLAAGTGGAAQQDAHSCGYGRWSASYYPADVEIRGKISKIKPVHEKIHEIADLVFDHMSFDKKEEAQAEILRLKESVMPEFCECMNELEYTLKKNMKEITVILNNNGKRVGIAADTADGVDFITEIQPLPEMTNVSKYIKTMGIRTRDKKLILIIEPTAFF